VRLMKSIHSAGHWPRPAVDGSSAAGTGRVRRRPPIAPLPGISLRCREPPVRAGFAPMGFALMGDVGAGTWMPRDR
jgi:hypothetical protein